MLRHNNPVYPTMLSASSQPDAYSHPSLQGQQRASGQPTDSLSHLPRARGLENREEPPARHLSMPPPIQEYSSAFIDEGRFPLPSRPPHIRQKSSPLLPSVSSITPSSALQYQSLAGATVPMPFTGDSRTGRGAESPRGGLAGWISSRSSQMSSNADEQDANTQRPTPSATRGDATPDTTPTRLRKNHTAASEPPTPKSSAASRLAVLTSSTMSAISRLTAPPAISPTAVLDDELLNLDIEAALFPSGSPSDRDAFSPAAFKNLHANAAGTLQRLQAAFRRRALALRDAAAERDAQREELDEAETRARHLKMQLEGMARRAAETEEAMRELAAQLAAERRRARRAEERLAREKSAGAMGTTSAVSEGSTVSEDLGVDEEAHRRRQWRASGGTVKSDASFDTDEEVTTEDESVFSRSRSPTIPGPALNEPGTETPSSRDRVVTLGPPRPRAATGAGAGAVAGAGAQMSTFRKIIKGISGEAARPEEEYSGPGCRNCKGQDASVAWDTVSLLRDENRGLKQRVGQLEVAVEGALDMVNGIGL